MNLTLAGFIKKEIVQTLRDKRMRILLFVMPCMQLTLFGVALSNEVKHIRLAAQFDSKDSVMRDIMDKATTNDWFLPVPSRGLDPYSMIEAGQADAVLIPPPGGFTRALGRGSAPLQLLVN